MVRRWSREGDAPTRVDTVRRVMLLALAWGPAGLATGGDDGAITIWPPGQELIHRALDRGNIEALAWSPTGDRLAAATGDGFLAMNAAGRGPVDLRELGDAAPLNGLECAPDADALAVVGERRALRRVATADGATSLPSRHTTAVWSTAWDPHGRFIATGAADGAVRLWPVQGGNPTVLSGHGDTVFAVAFDPRGERLVSAGADGRVIVWPLPSADLRAHLAAITSVCLSPAQRQTHLGEPADAALAAATACESAAGR